MVEVAGRFDVEEHPDEAVMAMPLPRPSDVAAVLRMDPEDVREPYTVDYLHYECGLDWDLAESMEPGGPLVQLVASMLRSGLVTER